MAPFDIHYLICLSENRAFFYWRAFAKPASLASKNNNKVHLLSSTDVELPTPKEFVPPYPHSTPYAIRASLQTLDLNSTSCALVHRVHAFDLISPLFDRPRLRWQKKQRICACWSIFKDLSSQSPFNFQFFPSPFFSISISFSNMTSSSKERYFGNVTKSRRSSPGESQNSVFFQGQGGRTVLPPLSDSFPTLRFPGLFFT